MHVLISEFMDAPAVNALRQRFDVRYAPDLVERRDDLLRAASAARAASWIFGSCPVITRRNRSVPTRPVCASSRSSRL